MQCPQWLRGKTDIVIYIVSVAIIIGSVWLLLKPITLPEPASYAEIESSRELALGWLERNFDGNLFRYQVNPERNEQVDLNNSLRQLMTSRVAASEAASSEAFLTIHRDNMAYIMSNWYREDEHGGYVRYQGWSKLGANAMLLRTLVASPDLASYAGEAKMVADGILHLQQSDGSFLPWYREPEYPYDAEYLMYFYSGEAMLALLEYYEETDAEAVLAAVEKAADYYLVRYVDQIDNQYHPAYVPWHTMAYSKLYAVTGNERYRKAIFVMNDRLLELLDLRVVPGRFYKPELVAEGQASPHASSDAVYLEGLIYAYEIADEAGDTERSKRYKVAIEQAITRLITSLQYQEEEPSFKAPFSVYEGAFAIHESNPSIRVDSVQHTLDAMAKYMDIFSPNESQND